MSTTNLVGIYNKGPFNVIDTNEVIILPEIITTEIKHEIPNKYHDIDCCEWTRGIDTLLEQYKHDRNLITSLIINDPDTLIRTIWKQNGPLAIDNECRCQMGNGDKRTSFACSQCRNLSRIIDFRLGGVERPFQIKCGNSIGQNFIVSSTDVSAPFLEWDNDSARRAKVFVQQYHNLTICGTPNIQNMKCITGDSFTIRTLIMWMIAKNFTELGLPHCPTMYTAFICNNIGYSLYNMPNIGTLSELQKIGSYHDPIPENAVTKALKSSIVRTIIQQLLVTLLELTKINFSHGTPSIHSLIFTKDPVSYLYDGVHVNGPITLQISDMWNASATFGNNHFFPKSVKDTMYIERNMFVPEIATKTVSMAHCYDIGVIDGVNESSSLPLSVVCPINVNTCPDATTYDVCKSQNVTLYRLTNNTIDIYSAMRHIGFPLYVGSFDFYCFMTSLMCDPSFFNAVMKDDKLYRLWSMMWLIDDLPNIERLIRETHNTEPPVNNRAASSHVVDIIRGAWLRCDIVKYIWSLIKLGW